MDQIGKNGRKTLKAFHLFFVSIWAGSWLCLILLLLLSLNNTDLVPILKVENQIHVFVVIPSVIGSLLTGILFSATTNWGFFKHRWIIIKYAANIFPMVGGALIFLPRLRGMIDIANQNLSATFSNPAFNSDKDVAVIFLIIEFAFICLAFYLSVFKPQIGPRKGTRFHTKSSATFLSP